MRNLNNLNRTILLNIYKKNKAKILNNKKILNKLKSLNK